MFASCYKGIKWRVVVVSIMQHYIQVSRPKCMAVPGGANRRHSVKGASIVNVKTWRQWSQNVTVSDSLSFRCIKGEEAK